MIEREKRSEMIRYWWSKAEECLASAHLEFKAGALSFAMNRLYYAAFYAVSALLMESDMSLRKHSGVRAAFHQHFVKTGVLDRKWGKLYDQLFEDRQEGDYVVFVTFEPDYVASQLTQCSQFLKQLQCLISSVSD